MTSSIPSSKRAGLEKFGDEFRVRTNLGYTTINAVVYISRVMCNCYMQDGRVNRFYLISMHDGRVCISLLCNSYLHDGRVNRFSI